MAVGILFPVINYVPDNAVSFTDAESDADFNHLSDSNGVSPKPEFFIFFPSSIATGGSNLYSRDEEIVRRKRSIYEYVNGVKVISDSLKKFKEKDGLTTADECESEMVLLRKTGGRRSSSANGYSGLGN
ncbi:uncharacterized protein G2W53_032693 [Senna tora]|uniref:Uncharacterized protein n=1 Tax=Senna tora TaxID=362788 RepID=A0A834W768_9FABA|nr:uncharacterized protein G2W53_032693 [Senna tora]